MLHVKTIIGQSSIHGIGLFAAEKIYKGALVSKWLCGFDIEIFEEHLDLFPQHTKDFLEHYGYTHRDTHLDTNRDTHTDSVKVDPKDNRIRVCTDNGRFTNHSKTPNLECRDEGTYAIRDILTGEELTEDYSTYEPDFVDYEPVTKQSLYRTCTRCNVNTRDWIKMAYDGGIEHGKICPMCFRFVPNEAV